LQPGGGLNGHPALASFVAVNAIPFDETRCSALEVHPLPMTGDGMFAPNSWLWEGQRSGMLDRERPSLITRRLPLFATGWLFTTAVWGLVLVRHARLTVLPATFLFMFQLGVLIAAIAMCHHRARPARIPVVALAACLLLGLSSTSLFAAIGGYGEMLAFILLTLFLASSPLFAWSGRSALILLVGTLVPWLLAIPFLRFFLHPLDLSAAIAIGATISLIVLEGSKRNARLALERARARTASPDVAEREETHEPSTVADGPGGTAPAPASQAEASPRPAAPPRDVAMRDDRPEHGGLAMLREPLRELKEEEVDGLRREVRRLRVEVNRSLAAEGEPGDEPVPEVKRRRRRRRADSGSSQSSVVVR